MINIPHLIKYKYGLAALCLLLVSFQTHAVQLAPLSGSEYVGDLAELEKKRVLRVLVAADLGFYYIEDGITKASTIRARSPRAVPRALSCTCIRSSMRLS